MRLKNLERYRVGGTSSRMTLGVPLPTTPNGRVYRYSPNENAHPRHFVLGNVANEFAIVDEARNRMRLSPRSKQTVCPYSGVIASDQAFTHPDDLKAAVKMVEHAAAADVEELFHNMFHDLAKKSSKFLKVETRGRPAPRSKPRFARRDLLRELMCDHCGRDYGVFAIGLFCPDCGAPNLRLHFAREVQLVARQVELADSYEEEQELAYRLMGNAHEDVLTAFEATLKAVYLYGVTQLRPGTHESKPVKNDFQNVENAQRRFTELSVDPFSILSWDELAVLKLNIQKRHIIGHNLGVMDEKFASHAADARIGETVRLIGEDILQFAGLAQRVVEVLDSWLVGGIPAPVSTLSIQNNQLPETAMQNKEVEATLGIGALAVRLGKWIAMQSENGLASFVDLDALLAAFSEADVKDVAEAIAELGMEGYVHKTATAGHILPHIRPTTDLFATFDPLSMDNKPIPDSVELAEKILQGPDSVDVAHLHEQISWPMRRFNPAIALVIEQVDDRRVSKEMQNHYPARNFRLAAEDRVALKRYIARHSQ